MHDKRFGYEVCLLDLGSNRSFPVACCRPGQLEVIGLRSADAARLRVRSGTTGMRNCAESYLITTIIVQGLIPKIRTAKYVRDHV